MLKVTIAIFINSTLRVRGFRLSMLRAKAWCIKISSNSFIFSSERRRQLYMHVDSPGSDLLPITATASGTTQVAAAAGAGRKRERRGDAAAVLFARCPAAAASLAVPRRPGGAAVSSITSPYAGPNNCRPRVGPSALTAVSLEWLSCNQMLVMLLHLIPNLLLLHLKHLLRKHNQFLQLLLLLVLLYVLLLL